MSHGVYLRPEAETDIEEAAAWYEKQREGLGVVMDMNDQRRNVWLCSGVFGAVAFVTCILITSLGPGLEGVDNYVAWLCAFISCALWAFLLSPTLLVRRPLPTMTVVIVGVTLAMFTVSTSGVVIVLVGLSMPSALEELGFFGSVFNVLAGGAVGLTYLVIMYWWLILPISVLTAFGLRITVGRGGQYVKA